MKEKVDHIEKIYEATARTAKNGRAWNIYGDDTETMDVWIEAAARTGNGFIEIGAYLSDIWETGAKDYREHMFIYYLTK